MIEVSTGAKFSTEFSHLEDGFDDTELKLCLFTAKLICLNGVRKVCNAKMGFTNRETNLPAEQDALIAVLNEVFLG